MGIEGSFVDTHAQNPRETTARERLPELLRCMKQLVRAGIRLGNGRRILLPHLILKLVPEVPVPVSKKPLHSTPPILPVAPSPVREASAAPPPLAGGPGLRRDSKRSSSASSYQVRAMSA